MTSPPPSEIGGYRVLGTLGEGAFSRVYKVVRMAGDGFRKELALKVLAPGVEATPDLRAMFVEEASVAAWLHHRNIVGVHEFGVVDEGCFLVMELVDGLDLRTFLRRLRGRKSWLPLPTAVHIVVKALHGLHHAHVRRDGEGKPLHIVHRDLKPDNILLSTAGATKVSDFGLARIRSELEQGTAAGFTRGTARFMSPEQATGRPVDARSDVFSAGILLYMLLASRLPFMGKSDLETMRAVARAQFQPIQLARPHVPDAVARALHRMLAPSPDSRYGSALEAAEALADAVEELVREPPERSLAAQLAGAMDDPIEDSTLDGI